MSEFPVRELERARAYTYEAPQYFYGPVYILDGLFGNVVTSFALNGNPARHGAIVINAGTNVTIVESPNNTFTISATGGGGGILTINGEGDAAQTITAFLPITVTSIAPDHKISINDYTATTRGCVPDPSLFSTHAFLASSGWNERVFSTVTSPGTGLLTQDTPTVQASIIVVTSGIYIICGEAGVLNPAGTGSAQVTISINGSVVCNSEGVIPTPGFDCRANLSRVLSLTAGQTVTLETTIWDTTATASACFLNACMLGL